MDQQDLALNRLLKKLSALRATLQSDERNLLDGLVTRTVSDVSAHSLRVTPISPAKSTAKATAADEARANAMKVNTAKSTAKATAADETRANAMKVNISFDQGKNEYTRSN